MTDKTESTNTNSQDSGSESGALRDILSWSNNCPMWQRDALRRLCTKGEPEDADLDVAIVANNGQYGGSNAYWPKKKDHVR